MNDNDKTQGGSTTTDKDSGGKADSGTTTGKPSGGKSDSGTSGKS
jgi:hypothetical protein